MRDTDGGTVMYRNLISHAPRHRLAWAAVGGSTTRTPEWMDGIPRVVRASPWYDRRLVGVARRVGAMAVVNAEQERAANRAVAHVIRFAQRLDIRAAWVHASGAALLAGLGLKRRLGVRLHLNVQDDVAGHLGEAQIRRWRPWFDAAVREADSVDVTSVEMATQYRMRYALAYDPPMIWTGGHGDTLPSRPSDRPLVTAIAYAGNLWAPDAMTAFLAGLTSFNSGRAHPCVLRVYGVRLPREIVHHRYVEFRGPRTPEQLTAELLACDLAYLPMGFGARHRQLSSTSLPGKTVHYMQAQLPIFAHGPLHATNVEFVRRHGVGVCCTSIESSDIAAQLSSLDRDVHARHAYGSAGGALFQNQFRPGKVWERLAPYVLP